MIALRHPTAAELNELCDGAGEVAWESEPWCGDACMAVYFYGLGAWGHINGDTCDQCGRPWFEGDN